jgi:tetratricopeptide (TPR) repeat protein
MRDNEIANILKQAIRKHDAGDFQFAENAYIKILEANPDHPEANFRMSMLAIRAMVWEDAAVFAAKAAKGAPGVISYRMTLANVLHKLRRYEEAERIMHSVYGLMRHTPEAARIAFNLVDLLVDMGRRAEAHAVCEDALQRQPNNEHLLYAKGKMLEAEGKMDEARAAYEAVLKRNKAHDQSLVRLGRIMDMKGQYSAYLDLVAPVASKSRSAALHAMAAAVYVHAGRNYEAVDSYRRALINSHVPNPMMHTAMLCSMVASDRIGDKELHDQSVFWDMLYKNGLQKLSFEGDRDPEKPLRVGVISAAFRRHTTSRILLPLLPELAKHFELFGYHDGFIEDDYTQRYKEMFKGWKSTVRLGYEDAAKAIREDKIDVLLDISGFLEGSRPPVLMFEPAPVQIHYCGGPMSLGLSCIRYRISDEVAEPAALCDANSSEKILRLEDGIFVYQPDVEVDDPGPIPQKKNGHITFGSCNALYKVSDTTLATWRAASKPSPAAGWTSCATTSTSTPDRVRTGRAATSPQGYRRNASPSAACPSQRCSGSRPTTASTSLLTATPTPGPRRRWTRSGWACRSSPSAAGASQAALQPRFSPVRASATSRQRIRRISAASPPHSPQTATAASSCARTCASAWLPARWATPPRWPRPLPKPSATHGATRWPRPKPPQKVSHVRTPPGGGPGRKARTRGSFRTLSRGFALSPTSCGYPMSGLSPVGP